MSNSRDGKSCHAVRPRECGAVGEEGGAGLDGGEVHGNDAVATSFNSTVPGFTIWGVLKFQQLVALINLLKTFAAVKISENI